MEQAVWISFGVIASILMIGIIAQLVSYQSTSTLNYDMQGSLVAMKQQCDFVCKSAQDTKLGTQIEIPSDLILYTNADKICMQYAQKDPSCSFCQCTLSQDKQTVLDLTNDLAKKAFKTHQYSCLFTKLAGQNIAMECVG